MKTAGLKAYYLDPASDRAYRVQDIDPYSLALIRVILGSVFLMGIVFVKKEWKALALIICLVGGIVSLTVVSCQLSAIEDQNAKIISTFDSIESVTLGTDAGLNELTKRVDKMESNVAYIVKKVRRR